MNRFFYNGIGNFFIILLLISCNTNLKNDKLSEKVNNISTNTSGDSISYRLFLTQNHTYGFDIVVNGKVFIHQPVIPGREGLNGFKTASAAEAEARLINSKLKSNNYKFLITEYETDSLIKATGNVLPASYVMKEPDSTDSELFSFLPAQQKNNSLISKLSLLQYAPVKNLWRSKGIVPFGHRAGALSFSIGNFVFIGGGELTDETINDFWCYNGLSDSWTCLAEFPGERRNGAIAFSVRGNGYWGLGQRKGVGFRSYLKDLYEYQPAKNKWFKKRDFAGTQRIDAVAFAINFKAYVGLGFDGEYKADIYQYDPLKDSWLQIAPFAGGPVSASLSVSNFTKGFVIAGDAWANNQKFVYEYLPATNQWQRKNDLPAGARFYLYGNSIDTNLLIAGGGVASGGETQYCDFYLFNTTENIWVRIPDYLVSKIGTVKAATGTADGKVFIGTGNNGNSLNDWNVYEYYFSVRKDTGAYDETVCYPLPYKGNWELYQECMDDDCYAGAEIKSSENLGKFCYSSRLTNSHIELSLKDDTGKNTAKFILLPRWFDISAEKISAKQIGLRLFFTWEEIENLADYYEVNTGKTFSLDKIKILQYNGKQTDLISTNNETDVNNYKIISPQLFSYGFQGETIVVEFNVVALHSEFYLAIPVCESHTD